MTAAEHVAAVEAAIAYLEDRTGKITGSDIDILINTTRLLHLIDRIEQRDSFDVRLGPDGWWRGGIPGDTTVVSSTKRGALDLLTRRSRLVVERRNRTPNSASGIGGHP